MSDIVAGALIGAGGAFLGIIVSLIVGVINDWWKIKQEKQKALLQLKLNTYADAIRYISLLCRISSMERQGRPINDYKELIDQESELYSKFHPMLALLSAKTVVSEFNALRDRIFKEQIKPEEAFKEVNRILDFRLE